MRRFRLILVGGLAGVVVGCGGGGGDGGPPTITSVVINGDSTVVLAGTRQLTAVALSGNAAVSGVTFEWTSSDTTRARVSGSGLVTGVRLGSTNITALAVLNGTPTSVSSPAHAIRTRIGSIVIAPGNRTFSSLGDVSTLTAEARDALDAAVAGGELAAGRYLRAPERLDPHRGERRRRLRFRHGDRAPGRDDVGSHADRLQFRPYQRQRHDLRCRARCTRESAR